MNPFHTSTGIENQYARQLRKIASEVGRIVTGYDFEDNFGQSILPDMYEALLAYSRIIKPWAARQADIMLTSTDRQNMQAWDRFVREDTTLRVRRPTYNPAWTWASLPGAAGTPPSKPPGGNGTPPPPGDIPPYGNIKAGFGEHSRLMGRTLKQQLRTTPIGETHRALLNEQVALITSLPTEAGQRVMKLAHEGLAGSSRGADLVKEIMRTGEVTKSRATLIARTETSRSRSTFTMARAESVGSEYFQWNTAHDSDVRPSHKRLDGKVFRWDSPPECDPGVHAIAGASFNCRCVCLPILPDED